MAKKSDVKLGGSDAFVFDLDGTLIDSGKYHIRAFADAVFEASGYRLTPEERREVFASHSMGYCPILNERHGLDLDPERVMARKRERTAEIFVPELFPGAREFLEKWRGKRPFGLATNSPADFVFHALEKLGIVDFFDVVTTVDDVSSRKPDPEIYLKTLERLEVEPARALVFEDQLIGIEAGRAAGAKVLAVDNGQPVAFPSNIPIFTWKALLLQA